MDYLHGDVAGDEFKAASYYEYARESCVLREAARLSRQELDLTEIDHRIERHFACGNVFLAFHWLEIFTCGLFPETPWNRLPAEVRDAILGAFPLPSGKVQALRMIDSRRLDDILDRLKEKVLLEAMDKAKLLDTASGQTCVRSWRGDPTGGGVEGPQRAAVRYLSP